MSAMRSRLPRETTGTILRILFCGLVAWLFTVGSYSAPINMEAALALSVMLSLLVTYELCVRDVRPEWVLGALFCPLAVILGAYWVWLSFQPPPPSGALVPAGEPTPPLRCSEKPGAHDLVVTFGTDTVIAKGPGAFTPVVVDDCPALSLVRRAGRLMIQSFGYDANGNILFRIKDNVYQALDMAELRVFRPDPSTFVLLNRYDREVIYVRYLNENAVRIRGHFLCGDAPQAILNDDKILAGGFMLRGAVFGAHATAGHVCAVTDARQPFGILIGEQPNGRRPFGRLPSIPPP
jgi:hypothetical protein